MLKLERTLIVGILSGVVPNASMGNVVRDFDGLDAEIVVAGKR